MHHCSEVVVNSYQNKADLELVEMIFNDPNGVHFDSPWGEIRKNNVVTEYFKKDIEEIQKRFHLDDISSSVALGKMEPGSFHKPYIRHAAHRIEYDPTPVRVYKIVAGAFVCVRDGEIKEYTAHDDYVVIHDLDIFSFKAGKNGCVFAIIDFPEFNMNLDAN